MVRICSRKAWIYIVLCFLNMTTVLILYRTFTATSEASRANSAEISKLSSIDVDFMINQAGQQLPILDNSHHSKNTTNYYRRHNREMSTRRTKQLLCSTFIRLTSAKIVDVLQIVVNSNNYCDWVIVVYAYESDKKDLLIQEFNQQVQLLKSKKQPLRSGSYFLRRTQYISITVDINLEFATPRHSLTKSVIDLCNSHILPWKDSTDPDICSSTGLQSNHINFESNEFNELIYPKSLLFFSLLPYLSSYQNVWLLDDDLSLDSFDMSSYINIWKCSTGHPPLISQPLIAENTQTYKFLNSNKWSYSKALSSTSGFIEIQAPLINSVYFEWFLLTFVMPLTRQSNLLGADWGFDSLLCKSAQYYLNNAMSNSENIVPCLIVVGSTPLHHINSKVTNNILGKDVKIKLNRELMRIIGEVFPDFIQSGKGPAADPLSPGNNFKQYYQLTEGCGNQIAQQVNSPL